jgi:DNA-binding transcriptional LysR family regulator
MSVLIRQLEYLVALSREGHFRRAAAACDVSQPALSAGIRKLEQDVGFPIVRRGQRYEGLTPEGERVLDWGQKILADVDGFRGTIDAMREGLTGRLRIGAIPTALGSVAFLTRPLCAAQPGITVEALSLTSRQIERGLHDFELELGLTYLDSEPLQGVRTLPLYRERYVLLTPARGPLGDQASVGWAEAAAMPLCLLTEDMQNRRIVNALFAEAGVEPRPTIETNSVSTLYSHVRDGTWSSVVAQPWLQVFGVPEGLRAIPLVAPEATRGIGLVWLDRDPEPLLAVAMLNIARMLDLESALGHVPSRRSPSSPAR